MIHLINYKKSYGNRLILNIPELKMDKGMYWIKGVNGVGKSTLFKSIAGIIDFKGDCIVDGMSIKEQPVTYRARVNYSEAEPLFPDFLTMKDLAEFVLTAKNAAREQLDMLITTFEVGAYYTEKLSTYSSGMLKKAGLLLAFLGQPSIIILDEPFITIDHRSIENLVRLITKLHAEKNVTFLIATHMDNKQNFLAYSKVYTIEDTQLVEL